jgi:hypothetical protein
MNPALKGEDWRAWTEFRTRPKHSDVNNPALKDRVSGNLMKKPRKAGPFLPAIGRNQNF